MECWSNKGAVSSSQLVSLFAQRKNCTLSRIWSCVYKCSGALGTTSSPWSCRAPSPLLSPLWASSHPAPLALTGSRRSRLPFAQFGPVDGEGWSQVNLGMATLLAKSVLLIIIADIVPITSFYTPLIGSRGAFTSTHKLKHAYLMV